MFDISTHLYIREGAYMHPDREIERQTDRLTDRQTDRKTDR